MVVAVVVDPLVEQVPDCEAAHLRVLAASPEQWWGLVRFDPDRSVRIVIEDQPEYGAWLVVLPPGDAGQDCDCDVATVIAGEATEGAPGSAVLRPGATRVHGQRHRLRGHGTGYSISLHARATPSTSTSANPRSQLSKTSARNSSSRNVEVIGLSGHGGTFRRAAREDSFG